MYEGPILFDDEYISVIDKSFYNTVWDALIRRGRVYVKKKGKDPDNFSDDRLYEIGILAEVEESKGIIDKLLAISVALPIFGFKILSRKKRLQKLEQLLTR